MGAANIPKVNVPAAPPPVDQFGQLISGYEAALRTSAARKGVASTFTTGPAAHNALQTGMGALGGMPKPGGG